MTIIVNMPLSESDILNCYDFLNDLSQDNKQNIFEAPKKLKRNFGLTSQEAVAIFNTWAFANKNFLREMS